MHASWGIVGGLSHVHVCEELGRDADPVDVVRDVSDAHLAVRAGAVVRLVQADELAALRPGLALLQNLAVMVGRAGRVDRRTATEGSEQQQLDGNSHGDSPCRKRRANGRSARLACTDIKSSGWLILAK